VATAAELGQRQWDVVDARVGQHEVGRAAAWQGSDAWNRREQEVALESLRRRTAVKHGSGRQSGGVSRRGEASTRPGSGGAEAGTARGRAQNGAGAVGATHLASQSSGGARQSNRGEGERGRRRRTQLQIVENAGTPL
jgi:hypothetical protein